MPGIAIPCPKCGMHLQLPDRKLLGRKGRCGQCGHKFVLEEPAPSKLEMAGASKKQPTGNETIMGMAPRWVADMQATPPNYPQHQPSVPGYPQQASYPTEPDYPAETFETPAADPLLGTSVDAGGVARLKELRKKNAKRRNMGLALGAVVLAVCGIAYAMFGTQEAPKKRGTKKDPDVAGVKAPAAGEEDEGLVVSEPVKKETSGKRIELKMIPAGARVVIHVRPADLWEPESAGEEFRACLGPLGTWLGEMIKTHCLFEPPKVAEALFCLIPSTKGNPPDLAVVVHTKEDVKKSELLEKFNGELKDEDGGRPYYQGEERAYMILDPRTFANVPSRMAEEMVESADSGSITADGIQDLLQQTDRERHFTVVFEPIAVSIDSPFLVPDLARPLLKGVLDWVGDDVEAVCWSFHLGDKFDSEVVLRNSSVTSPPRLQKSVQTKLQKTPREILSIVEMMNPQEIGPRKLIGRFPAMVKTVALNTHVDTGNRSVTLTSNLPERAAPNLALAGLLAWDHSTRADFGKNPGVQPSEGTGKKVPELLADRLRTKIDVDFRNEPLYQAINFVGEEIGAKFKIEGNDLKMVGVTQNMKQEFKMDGAPATAVLHRILDKIQLVIVVDEDKKLITVTSAKMAEEKNLKVFPLAPGGG